MKTHITPILIGLVLLLMAAVAHSETRGVASFEESTWQGFASFAQRAINSGWQPYGALSLSAVFAGEDPYLATDAELLLRLSLAAGEDEAGLETSVSSVMVGEELSFDFGIDDIGTSGATTIQILGVVVDEDGFPLQNNFTHFLDWESGVDESTNGMLTASALIEVSGQLFLDFHIRGDREVHLYVDNVHIQSAPVPLPGTMLFLAPAVAALLRWRKTR